MMLALNPFEVDLQHHFSSPQINPLVPRVQKIKILNLTLKPLLIVEFVMKMVYLGAHYSERQGLMGFNY